MKYLPVIYLSLHDDDVMFTSRIKLVNGYFRRVFIPVSRYVKVLEIHQGIPELLLQMYCHLFHGSQCIIIIIIIICIW